MPGAEVGAAAEAALARVVGGGGAAGGGMKLAPEAALGALQRLCEVCMVWQLTREEAVMVICACAPDFAAPLAVEAVFERLLADNPEFAQRYAACLAARAPLTEERLGALMRALRAAAAQLRGAQRGAHAQKAPEADEAVQVCREVDVPSTLSEALQSGDAFGACIITDAAEELVVHVNCAWVDMCKYTAAEALGRSVKELLHGPATEKEQLQKLMSFVRAGYTCSTVVHNYAKGEQEAFVNKLTVCPLRSSEGAITHFAGYLVKC